MDRIKIEGQFLTKSHPESPVDPVLTRWPKVRMGEVLHYRKQFITIDDLAIYKRPRVQLHAQGIVLRDEVPGALIKTKTQQVCRAGEFLVAEIDAKVGGFGIVPETLEGSIVSSHYFLFKVNEAKLDRRFLDYFIRTPGFRDQIEAQGSTNYAAIRQAHVLEYQMPLPPLHEQRRVVARIEEVAAQIQEAHTLRQQAVDEAEALWQRAAENIFDKLVETNSLRPLSELVSIRGGGTPSKADPFYWDGNIPWITPKDMKARELSDAIDHISERATHETAAKLIAPGGVLVVVRGMILTHTFPSAVLRSAAAINQDMKALAPNGEILPKFLCAMFWAHNPRILDLVEKSTHDTRKLETAKLLDTKIVVPPLAEQRRIVAELDALQVEVDALKRLQAETAAELDALLPSILDRAFRGEL
jgi:type I restriction enzyme S subunit